MALPHAPTSVWRCAALLAGVLVVGTVGFAFIERQWTLWQCMYFTLVTITTVGYGDYGLSQQGQLFAALLLVCGISVFTYSLSTLVQIASDQQAALRRAMKRKIEDCNDHIIICGYGRMGRTICQEIKDEGVSVVIVENHEESIERAIADGLLVVEGEASEDEVLMRAGLMRARGVVCAVDSDAENLFVTVTVRELNPNCQVISRAENERAARKLQHAGASLIVSPHKMAGHTVASAVLCPRMAKYVNGYDDDDQAFKIGETYLEPGSPIVGQTVAEFGLQVEGLVFVAIERANGQTRLRPRGPDLFADGDIVIYAGGTEDIAFIKKAAKAGKPGLVFA